MARSDLLLSLIKAGVSSDQRLLHSTVEAIVADERGKQHNVLADRLQNALRNARPMSGHLRGQEQPIRPEAIDRGRDALVETVPRRQLDELVLTQHVLAACRELIEEQQRVDLLRSYSLEPRHRVLLVGPPGNGKTTLAEALAEALSVPFFVVRYESVIGSYLGETASRLKRVFDYARNHRCVLFFDEFDAVGKERGDKHDTGEIKRVVTSLLMQIDDLPSHVVVVAATNHSELLDRAVWRRFQLRLELPNPTTAQTAELIDRFFERMEQPVGISGAAVARKLGPLSFAEAEEFCLDVMRRHVLALGVGTLKEAVYRQLDNWSRRVKPGELSGGASRGRTSPSKGARLK